MEIRKVACIGAGLIGHGWATLFAGKGYDVTLQDLKEDILDRALCQIRQNLEFLDEKGLLKSETCEDAVRRLKVTTNLEEAVRDVEYVQERVFESCKVKKHVFELMDAATSPQAILASSTSTLKMTNIQKVIERPERCIVAHPWNPPYLMPLIEVIPGKKTSAETVKTTQEFRGTLGKVPVLQKIPAMEARWRSLAAWTSLSSSAEREIIKGVKRTKLIQEKPIEDIIRWRDDKLAELLRVLYSEGQAHCSTKS